MNLATLALAILAVQDPPASTINDLGITGGSASSLTVTWTAPTDTGPWGPEVAHYELRYQDYPFTDHNFDYAPMVPLTQLPRGANYATTPGTPQTGTITGLVFQKLYYIAIKSVTYGFIRSDLSNEASGRPRLDWTTPASIGSFRAAYTAPDGAVLTWKATGDDDLSGTAATTDLRYSDSPIDASNVHLAGPVPGVTPPASPGSDEEVPLTGLTPGKTWYFALEVRDEDGNSSGIVTARVFVGTPSSGGGGGGGGGCSSRAGLGISAGLLLLALRGRR